MFSSFSFSLFHAPGSCPCTATCSQTSASAPDSRTRGDGSEDRVACDNQSAFNVPRVILKIIPPRRRCERTRWKESSPVDGPTGIADPVLRSGGPTYIHTVGPSFPRVCPRAHHREKEFLPETPQERPLVFIISSLTSGIDLIASRFGSSPPCLVSLDCFFLTSPLVFFSSLIGYSDA